jgi:hypothetical protein
MIDLDGLIAWAAFRCGSISEVSRRGCDVRFTIEDFDRFKPLVQEGGDQAARSYSAASLWPSRALSLWMSSSAASAITVPGGKIASAPALYSAS